MEKIEEKLPNLLKDINDIVGVRVQTDPDFKTRRHFTRLTVKEIKNNVYTTRAIHKNNYQQIKQ